MENENISLKKEGNENQNQNQNQNAGGIGELLGRFFRFLGRMIKKGNTNYFLITKENEKPIKIPITLFVILLLVAFWPVVIILAIGLFLRYKYSFTGPNINGGQVNDVMSKVSDTAQNIKNDFEKGYNDNNQ